MFRSNSRLLLHLTLRMDFRFCDRKNVRGGGGWRGEGGRGWEGSVRETGKEGGEGGRGGRRGGGGGKSDGSNIYR